MKVEKWTRSRLNRFLPILRQLQDEDFQSELTELFEKSSSAKVIKFLEEIIPKGFIEDIFPKIYKDESINIVIQFADINLEFVIQKIISSSDKVIVNTYFSKLGHNPGNLELREEFDNLLISDCKSMMKEVRSKFNLNHYSNYKFKLESILLEENSVVKNSSVEDLFVKIHCYSKEDILLFTTPICFKRDTRVSMDFKFVEIQEMMGCKPTSKMTEENFVKSFLETATYWYRFN